MHFDCFEIVIIIVLHNNSLRYLESLRKVIVIDDTYYSLFKGQTPVGYLFIRQGFVRNCMAVSNGVEDQTVHLIVMEMVLTIFLV